MAATSETRENTEAAAVTDAGLDTARRQAEAAEKYRLTTLSDEELQALYNACADELERRYHLATAKTRIEEATASYEKAVENNPAIKVTDVPEGGLGPGEKLIDAWGVEWVNQSGAWLQPRTAGPDQYPAGWRKTNAPAANAAPAWKPGETVKAGDLRLCDGIVWRALRDHVSEATSKPGKAGTLWVKA